MLRVTGRQKRTNKPLVCDIDVWASPDKGPSRGVSLSERACRRELKNPDGVLIRADSRL